MNDSQLMQLIALKLSGEATEEQLRKLDEYILEDPEAGHSLEVLSAIWNPATNLGEESAVQELFDTHRDKYALDFDRFKETSLPETRSGFWTRYRKAGIYALAASVVLLLAGAAYWITRSQSIKDGAGEIAEIVVKKGSRSRVILPDSTEVWLNGGSRLSYDKDMNSRKARLVSLRGEGYFVVGAKKEQPFIVHTDKISILVLGTTFTVRAYEKDSVTETTLMRGKIQVSMVSDTSQKLILNPNERFSVGSNQTIARGSAVSGGLIKSMSLRQAVSAPYQITQTAPVEITNKLYNKDTCWLHGQLVFKNEPFREIIPELEKRYDVKIELQNPKLGNCRYTAILDKESIEEVLKAMRLIQPFTYTLITNTDQSKITRKIIIK